MPTRRRRLDTRSLLPRDYLLLPYQFGYQPDAAVHLPPGGDTVSLAVAQVQHQISCRLRADPNPHRATLVTARFGFSKQFWSLCLSGQAWMGETVLAAAINALPAPAVEDGDGEGRRGG